MSKPQLTRSIFSKHVESVFCLVFNEGSPEMRDDTYGQAQYLFGMKQKVKLRDGRTEGLGAQAE